MPKKEKKDNLDLRSEEVQEILSNPPVWIVRWGITLIFMFVCIIISLSFMIKYPDFVTAKVLVTTKQPTEKIISRYSGQLEKIFIKNRDTVTINQKLAVIKNTANFNDVYLLKSILDSLPFNIKTFKFPFDKTAYLILGDISTAYFSFEKSYIDYYLLKDLDPYKNQLNGNKVSLKELRNRLKSQVNQKKLLEQEYKLKQTDFERDENLFKKGVISQREYELKQLSFIQMQKNISAMAISISQMTEAISSANQTLKNTRINEQEDNSKFLKNLIQSYDLLKEAIRNWEYNYVLTSSINGVVSFQDYWGENQFVNSGNIVFSILPSDTSKLVGKLLIPAQNAGKVIVGQKVFIKLDNFPYQQYGMLIGKVTNFSISPNSEDNYTVFISLPNGTETSYNKNFKFTQELLGNAEIITENLSVAERMFYKFKDIFKY
ncbi:secretion protein HlyD [Polaribacter reichenbachii]|uniref:Secretion protein HlyD n=1 Tax=Polaribacter reichenbachii TaxID=996801 RepID=A0A1B8U6U5_9FLAO|nr:HlyD family efflux transporter periplasmic adaptor subunit [Polaribacter reichenbachii]APZ46321.1 secretion protein HlyD [Polaribacter reichenbachii]AUC20184.1 secretion protein HlyD [Polaribacter reichenbachii]OBY67557.1 secretion protein HlyD [Polaribacter reichenbachii]